MGKTVLWGCGVISVLVAVLWLGRIPASASGEQQPTLKQLQAIQARHQAQLLALKGVAGMGIGRCGPAPCFEVYLEQDTPELRQRLPRQLEGITVKPVVTGPIRAR
jgi:hypothetical protein